ncbi:MAG: hypothetical protein NTY09_14245 [bacterium]|nr:hypothetical protein [bacterium]
MTILKSSLFLFILILFFTAQVYSAGASENSIKSSGEKSVVESNGAGDQTASPSESSFKDDEGQKDEEGTEQEESAQPEEGTGEETVTEDEGSGETGAEGEDTTQPEEEGTAEETITEEVVPEETEAAPAEEVITEESPMVVTYLDNLVDHEGWLTLAFKLSESGEGSYFYQRYSDTFPGDPFYLGDLFMRGWNEGGSRYWFNVQDSWDSSYRGSLRWNQPGRYNFFLRYNTYDHSMIPSTFPGTRTDFTSGVQANSDGNTYGFNYAYHANEVDAPSGSTGGMDWASNGIGANFDLNWCDWHGSIDFNYHDFANDFNHGDFVEHTGGTLRLGRDFGPGNYVEGNFAYSLSEPKSGDQLETSQFGGYARFMDTSGPNRFFLTSHINWINRDGGPSKLHPVGDEFNFDLNAEWHPVENFSIQSSWEHQKSDFTHADQYTIFGFRFHPDFSSIANSVYFQDTVTMNVFRVGADWDINDDFSFSADFNWTGRDDLPFTDVVYVNSSPLWWENENHYVYTLRYNKGGFAGIENGSWLMTYETRRRENGARGSSSSVEQFHVNYTGMINPDLWLYAGGGYFTMKNSLTGTSESQNGPDYGGGLTWNMGEKLTFFSDLWIYNVGGDYGYDETSASGGFRYDLSDEWNWSLEYDRVKGDFVDMTNLDYVVENLLLNFTYKW